MISMESGIIRGSQKTVKITYRGQEETFAFAPHDWRYIRNGLKLLGVPEKTLKSIDVVMLDK